MKEKILNWLSTPGLLDTLVEVACRANAEEITLPIGHDVIIVHPVQNFSF